MLTTIMTSLTNPNRNKNQPDESIPILRSGISSTTKPSNYNDVGKLEDDVTSTKVSFGYGTIWHGHDAKMAASANPSNAKEVRICFRNLTNDILILCWVGEDGTYHHFYTLHPYQPHQRRKINQQHVRSTTVGWLRRHVIGESESIEENDTITITDNDHVETSLEGHAFVVVSTPDIVTVQENQSFDSVNFHTIGAYRADPNHDISDLSVQDEALEKIHLVEVLDPIQTTSLLSKKRRFSFQTIGNYCITCCRPKRKYKDENENENDIELEDVEANVLATESNTQYVLMARLVRQRSEEVHDTTKKYYEKKYLGQCKWPVMLEPKWYGNDPSLEDILVQDLDHMASCLPTHALTLLRDISPTPIWVNKTLKYGPKHCPVQGHGMCFHPASDWLKQQGMNIAKCESVELYNASEYRTMRSNWGIGGILLHEFSHAYHHKGCTDGYDNIEIQQCYEAAMQDGIYDSVPVHGSQGPVAEAYAKTDAMEYFAELSTAFLGGIPPNNNINYSHSKVDVKEQHSKKYGTSHDEEYNKWYPFNRQQILEHDPRAYELLKKMWKVNDAYHR
jgi:hypothetical protein